MCDEWESGQDARRLFDTISCKSSSTEDKILRPANRVAGILSIRLCEVQRRDEAHAEFQGGMYATRSSLQMAPIEAVVNYEKNLNSPVSTELVVVVFSHVARLVNHQT